MSQRSMSLVDILTPPRNNWLRQLARRKSDLPAGVRVVRFSDYDDEPEVVEATTSAPTRQDHAIKAQAAVPTRSSATASAKRMPSTAAESIPPA
jgi:hypothetical protein